MQKGSERLYISKEVIERLRSGQFKPVRSSRSDYKLNDRRDKVSPLALTKRAVRYEPYVFLNRSEQILDAVESLNNDRIRSLCITGYSGVGKTAFARAVVEMMGGTPAQLLWFDASDLSDEDAVIRFMIEYLIYLCQAQQAEPILADSLSPIEHLKQLLTLTQHLPILLLVDNIDVFLNHEGKITSDALSEMFSFVLGFSNIKLMLIGNKLPDLNLKLDQVETFEIEPLNNEAVWQWWQRQQKQFVELSAYDLTRLDGLKGLPELAWAWVRVLKNPLVQPEYKQFLIEQAQDSDQLELSLLEVVQASLPKGANDLLNLLSLVRHSLSPNTMKQLAKLCFGENIFETLSDDESILVRVLMKKAFPPQSVLMAVRSKLNSPQTQDVNLEDNTLFEPSYELIPSVINKLQKAMDENVRLGFHRRLIGFYTEEKNKPLNERFQNTRTRYLVGEIHYHEQTAKRFNDYKQAKTFDPRKIIDTQLPEVSVYSLPSQPKQNKKSETKPNEPNIKNDNRKIPTFDNDLGDFLQSSTLSQNNPSLGKALLKKLVQDNLSASSAIEIKKPPKNETSIFINKMDEIQTKALPILEANNVPSLDLIELLSLPSWSQLEVKQAQQLNIEKLSQPDQYQLFKKMGEYYLYKKDYEKAEENLKQALRITQTLEVPDSLFGSLYQQLGACYQQLGQPIKSVFNYHHALKYWGDDHANDKGNCYLQLGLLADQLNKTGKALKYYVASLKYYRQTNNVKQQALLLFNIGNIQLEKDQIAKGTETIKQSMVLDEACNNLKGAAKSAELLSDIYSDNNQYTASLHMLEKAIIFSQESNNLQEVLFLKIKLGQLHEAYQQFDFANQAYQSCLDVQAKHSPQLQQWLQKKIEHYRESVKK